MNRAKAILSKALLLSVPFAAAVATSAPSDAQAQEIIVAPPPPPAYIATVQPEYYEGRAVYYYGGNWYYRGEGGRWGHYRGEPAYLHERRAHWDEHHRYHYYR